MSFSLPSKQVALDRPLRSPEHSNRRRRTDFSSSFEKRTSSVGVSWQNNANPSSILFASFLRASRSPKRATASSFGSGVVLPIFSNTFEFFVRTDDSPTRFRGHRILWQEVAGIVLLGCVSPTPENEASPNGSELTFFFLCFLTYYRKLKSFRTILSTISSEPLPS